MTKESIALYYREGSSDKVYQAALVEVSGGFLVNFAYGRRGSTLNTGSKTQTPVPYDEAKNIYDTLVKSKTAKGYTPGEEGTPYQHSDKEVRLTDIRPQLCNPIDSAEVKKLLTDNDYYMQEKFDGKRILLRKDQDTVVGINRKGLMVGLPESIVQSARQYDESFLLDGECLGAVLHVFDLLALDSVSLLTKAYSERMEMLQQLLVVVNEHLVLVPTAGSQTQKHSLFLKLKGANKEGVVFKNQHAPYTAGRPASGGSWLKHKFTTTGSFIVNRINSRRSVGLEVCDGKDRVSVGNVTIPANKKTPKLGSIIEIRYLYAFKGGSLFQPVFLHERDDLDAKDCVIGQLKFKAADGDTE